MKLNSSIKKEKEVDMLELFLMTILISAMEPLNCDGTDEVPSVVRKMLPQITAGENTAVIEIKEGWCSFGLSNKKIYRKKELLIPLSTAPFLCA